MSIPKEIKLTKDGGNYYRGRAFHYAFTILILPIAFVAILLAVINPLWFRDDFFRWVELTVNKVSAWRNYRHYAIYLGTDPKMWHALKDQAPQYDSEVQQSP